MNASVTDSNSIAPASRRLGCCLFNLTWILLNLLCGVIALIGSEVTKPGSLLGRLTFSITTALPLFTIIGFIVPLSLGLKTGPRKWPNFYRWIESHDIFKAVEPGAIAGVLSALIGFGITINRDTDQLELYILMFALTILLIGPIFGAAGGMVAASIVSRFRGNGALIFKAGVFGGAMAGLVIGILPNAFAGLNS